MSNTPLNECDMNNLKEIEQLGKDFKNDYKLITLQINNMINRYENYILIPTLKEKTVECNNAISFLDDNNKLYIAIKQNSDVLPTNFDLPIGYTDVQTFLTDFETFSTYKNTNCEDVYENTFHPNMTNFYNLDELDLIESMYNNITTFKTKLNEDSENNISDIFNIQTRINEMVKTLLSTLG